MFCKQIVFVSGKGWTKQCWCLEAQKQAEEWMSRSDIHITRFIHHWNLQTVYGKWRMMKIRTIGTYKIIQLYESERLDDSTPNINLIGLHLFFKLYLLFVSNKMWSYPFNIAQSLTYKPATSAWGCNTVSSNTDSTPTMKRGQKWAYCVEALGLIYTSASSNPVFCVKLNFKKTSTSSKLVGRSNFIPNKPYYVNNSKRFPL